MMSTKAEPAANTGIILPGCRSDFFSTSVFLAFAGSGAVFAFSLTPMAGFAGGFSTSSSFMVLIASTYSHIILSSVMMLVRS